MLLLTIAISLIIAIISVAVPGAAADGEGHTRPSVGVSFQDVD